jgi:SAM domain (Sterile alpha motif)
MLGLGRFKESLKRLKCANTGHSPVGSGPDYSLPNRPIAKLDTPQRLSDHPAKPCDVRAMDVGGWLRGLGLGQYEEKFQDNTIDAALVPRPTVDDFTDIDVSVVGDPNTATGPDRRNSRRRSSRGRSRFPDEVSPRSKTRTRSVVWS